MVRHTLRNCELSDIKIIAPIATCTNRNCQNIVSLAIYRLSRPLNLLDELILRVVDRKDLSNATVKVKPIALLKRDASVWWLAESERCRWRCPIRALDNRAWLRSDRTDGIGEPVETHGTAVGRRAASARHDSRDKKKEWKV
jgi:hypothetical protein